MLRDEWRAGFVRYAGIREMRGMANYRPGFVGAITVDAFHRSDPGTEGVLPVTWLGSKKRLQTRVPTEIENGAAGAARRRAAPPRSGK